MWYNTHERTISMPGGQFPSSSGPPFRAEHVGSLLRPATLLDARGGHRQHEIDDATMLEEETSAIRAALDLQERVGLRLATDGEFRRPLWPTLQSEGAMQITRCQFTLLIKSAAITLSAALILFSLSGHSASSQTISPVKIVVPVSPGGANDYLARVLAEQIGRAQGLAFAIENRTGAGGIIGAQAVSRSAPDGSSLLIDSNNLLIDALVQKTNYHPLTSFEPICNLVDAPTVLTVNGTSPYRRLVDLIDAARAKPREITLATLGGDFPNWLRETQARSQRGYHLRPVPGHCSCSKRAPGRACQLRFLHVLDSV
jgi:Tripartite tricarboxylate transporter family receptor